MDLYPLLRPILFNLNPETAHTLTVDALRLTPAGLLRALLPSVPEAPCQVMGLRFPNPVGLAAGLDKNGECLDAWAAMGFGFIEVGTVTPRPQPGNPKPRMFRMPEANAIINRMGFNNHGVDALLANVAQAKFDGILGINIGKNADTPIERAVDDYLIGLRKVYARASYVAVNISSPNTKNLRALQGGSELDALLAALKAEQTALADRHGKYTPFAVKIAPDLEDAQIAEMAGLFRRHRVDAVIATNTTLARTGVEHLKHGAETGGLSGAPVKAASDRVLKAFADGLAGEVPLIGVGGILQGSDARDKIAAGASLVQIYSGLIFRGPELVAECVRALQDA
ncbi:quinone-dependent dihydroorotate dehydrogenase [Parasulfuritortus cantonensis]|uniref:Dihydroorotate dehydrogenase (quinone) n=1 Tax=Parasulfuritortus cantonensis TaxID=2528202 RepID=A0A4R1B0J9_9PROT|nr:quinone-dependent dihydroorotate dehydrogenase [Parasulfuritortus cantonensis]TCJ11502.1 quinone-dependent dihydroorotate dehydrogenase [Parasulfuritortus cantonensis]